MDVNQLEKQRIQFKAKLTRFINKINIETDRANHLKLMLSSIEPLLEEFSQLQSQIELLSQSDVDDIQHESLETPYFHIISKIQDAIEQLSINNTSSNNVLQTQSSVPPSQVSLPAINLPNFSGIYDEWTTFRDTFEA